MPRAPAPQMLREKRQTKAQIERVFAASKAAGYPVRVELLPDGRIIATPCNPVDAAPEDGEGWGDLN